jgi:uncharacterized protein
MANEYRTPGVYIQELNAFPNSVAGVPTTVTAFLGRANDGPVNVATQIFDWGDFERLFGGLAHHLPLTYAVQQFYANGGGEAYIVRLAEDAAAVDAPWLSPPTYFGDRTAKTGLHALDDVANLNLLCIPPDGRMLPDVPVARQQLDPSVRTAALDYCVERGAFFIMDPPVAWNDKLRADQAADIHPVDLGCWPVGSFPPDKMRNAAVYAPTIQCEDPLANDAVCDFAPCGAIAGQYCATDIARGVWKAPAGVSCGLAGVRALTVKMDDAQNGLLNQQGINALRDLVTYGPVIWGARTLAGADALADDYKYIPVRRLALYIEQSIRAAIQWAVFEQNDEQLWARLRLSIESFMLNLWQQGAVLDQFVRCDASTTTQADIAAGVVNIQIGFAPIKPAEYVVLIIQQQTAQSS